MSYADGWAALNLEMPPRVPRTEYSAPQHWDLVRAVTGLEVYSDSPAEVQTNASVAFMQAWSFDFVWNTTIGGDVFGDVHTSMGHAVYATDGVDFNTNRHSAFSSPEEVLAFDPEERLPHHHHAALVQRFDDNWRGMCALYPDCVNMCGIYTTLMSGLIDLFGWDLLLLAAGTDLAAFGQVANRYSRWIQGCFDALAESASPVVMIHDDMVWTQGAFLRPSWYREYLFPNLRRQLAPLVEAGKIIMFTSDGNYTEFIDDVAECGVSGFVMEPSVDMAYIAEKYGRTHSFVGNADCRILLNGTRAQIRAEVERCMAIGKTCPGFFMAVGNHLPPNTPVANALYYNEVYEELSRR
jgi:hypothetical protein